MTKAQILIVEDEAIVAEDIKNVLENLGYVVSGTVSSGEESIERAHEDKPDLVLMDIVLQGELDGIEAAHQIYSRYDIPIVFLTSCTDPGTMGRSKLMDLYGCIYKPFKEGELSMNIDMALCKHKVVGKLKEIFEKSHRDSDQTINALASVSEVNDSYAVDHQRRVACLVYAIAQDLNLPEEKSKRIRMAAIIHDIGKINIPAEILGKPGKLTDSEFSIVKSHARKGFDMLKNIGSPWSIKDAVLHHHERINGSGYPDKLIESDITLAPRILAVADVVEAMSSPRSYRPAHSLEITLEELFTNRDILYDPLVVDTCLHLFSKKGFRFE